MVVWEVPETLVFFMMLNLYCFSFQNTLFWSDYYLIEKKVRNQEAMQTVKSKMKYRVYINRPTHRMTISDATVQSAIVPFMIITTDSHSQTVKLPK